jgi:hypothetical protein
MAAAKKKKKRSLFCAALVAGTINKLEQSIWAFDIYGSYKHLKNKHRDISDPLPLITFSLNGWFMQMIEKQLL